MAEYKLILPSMGEGIMEATVTHWIKSVGDKVEEDESVVEVATDKVDSDVPSPKGGILKEILVEVNGIAKVGEPLAVLEIEGENETEENKQELLPKPEKKPQPALEESVQIAAKVAEKPLTENASASAEIVSTEEHFFSPLVKSIALKENISIQELKSIKGTGVNQRVTKDDVLHYIALGKKNSLTIENPSEQKTPAVDTPTQSVAPPLISEKDEIIEMDRMRKIIAQHMVESVHTSPHVSSFVETDMTNIVLWRNKIKDTFQKREGEKITFMPIIVQAIVKAIKDFPMINVSISGDKIIKKGNINIGIAAARPDGNLIVPVIKNADQLSLIGLTKKINDLAYRAKNNQLKPDEIQNGTYTVSNIGSFGNILGTPIINQPQVAIMAIGSIEKKPAVIETPQGDMIAIRHKMYLSHSYDHRVIDGALGGMFVKRVSEYLENFDTEQEI